MSRTADVYSLGWVLFECLTGAAPFHGESGIQVLWVQLTAIPGAACGDQHDAPNGLGAAFLQPLAKDVDERPDDALVYVATLCRTAGIEPVRV